MAQSMRKRVYAWEFPVRLTHWINVLAILTLCVTGFYIGAPFMHATSSKQYIMGTVRFIHFIAGYTLLCSLIIRIYWAFMGNKYASWRVWFPFNKQRRADFMDAVKYYTFLSRKPPYAVGHTAIAGLAYFFVFGMFAFQIFSGFAMYSQAKPGGVVWALLGGWMLALADIQILRMLHHVVMYLLVVFVFIHIYIAWWLDSAEKNGLMGSIFGGYKFVSGKEWE